MSRQALRQNPFRVLTHPDVVLAAVESSEHLSRLNRHLCRPLDRAEPDSQVAESDPPASRSRDEATRPG